MDKQRKVVAPKGDLYHRIAVTLSWSLWESAAINWTSGKECPVGIEELFEPMGFPLSKKRAEVKTQSIHEKGLPERRIRMAVPLPHLQKRIRLVQGMVPAEYTAIRVEKLTDRYHEFLKFHPGKFFLSTEDPKIYHALQGAYGGKCVVTEPISGKPDRATAFRQLIDIYVCRGAKNYLGEKGKLFDLLALQPKAKKEE